MDFRILGPLEVWDGDRQLSVRGSKQRALLAVLLLNANEVVSTDRLIDLLWGDEPPDAGGTALRVRVSQLRKTLGKGSGSIVTQIPGYALRIDDDDLDLGRFERLVAGGGGCVPGVGGGPTSASAGALARRSAGRVRVRRLRPGRHCTARGPASGRPRAANRRRSGARTTSRGHRRARGSRR